MKKTVGIMFLSMTLPFLAMSCGKEEPKQAVVPVTAPVPSSVKPAPGPDTPVADAGVIDAKKRNPFQSYIVLMRGVESGKKAKGPLECCELNVFKLLAVVKGEKDAYALVQAPDGKRYIVRKGDSMGARDGRVVRFEARGITVAEPNRDEDGKVVSYTDMELKLPSEKGFEQGKKPY